MTKNVKKTEKTDNFQQISPKQKMSRHQTTMTSHQSLASNQWREWPHSRTWRPITARYLWMVLNCTRLETRDPEKPFPRHSQSGSHITVPVTSYRDVTRYKIKRGTVPVKPRSVLLLLFILTTCSISSLFF